MTPDEADARFESLLLDVLGEKSLTVSPDLRGRLRVLWREGVQDGLFLERERKEVPAEVFTKWEPRKAETLPDDHPSRAPGKYQELQDAKHRLVIQIEELGIEVEHELNPERTLGVGGVDLVKARHKFLTRVQQLSRAIERLQETLAGFRE